MGFLSKLESIVQNRKSNPVEGSYTNALFEAGRQRLAQKVGEEAVEIVVAALSQDRAHQVAETADLLYHLLVLMSDLDISLEDVEVELERRHAER